LTRNKKSKIRDPLRARRKVRSHRSENVPRSLEVNLVCHPLETQHSFGFQRYSMDAVAAK
jgi:hypothetical protein